MFLIPSLWKSNMLALRGWVRALEGRQAYANPPALDPLLLPYTLTCSVYYKPIYITYMWYWQILIILGHLWNETFCMMRVSEGVTYWNFVGQKEVGRYWRPDFFCNSHRFLLEYFSLFLICNFIFFTFVRAALFCFCNKNSSARQWDMATGKTMALWGKPTEKNWSIRAQICID